MKKNVLIFSGGSYPGIQIFFCLKNNLRFRPIMGSSYTDHSAYVCSDSYDNLPYINDPLFVDKLNSFLLEYNVQFIIPTHDTIALVLAQNRKIINAIVVCSSYETAYICRHKSKTYEVLKEYDFVPEIYNCDNIVDFPIFAKNDIGQGSQNAYIINSQNDIEKIRDGDISYIFCEYLPGDEITIDCFTDRRGELRLIAPRTRDRIMNGIAAHSKSLCTTSEIKTIAETINKRIKFRGCWFIQCKCSASGKYKLLEVSTRLSGTFGVTKSLDINLPLLALCDFSDMDIQVKANNTTVVSDKTYIDRYSIEYNYQRVYIDYDDTLVFEEGKYNSFALMYLFQCLNKHIEIILITKHEHDILDTLQRLLIPKELFAAIICVPIGRNKYEYISTDKPSIFIDNAFHERVLAKDRLGIPTYDPCNIDCLIDWSV